MASTALHLSDFLDVHLEQSAYPQYKVILIEIVGSEPQQKRIKRVSKLSLSPTPSDCQSLADQTMTTVLAGGNECWVLAVNSGNHIPFFLHSQSPTSFLQPSRSHLLPALCACIRFDKIVEQHAHTNLQISQLDRIRRKKSAKLF